MSLHIVRVPLADPASALPQSALRAAYERMEGRIRAVSEAQFVPMNIDPHQAAVRVLGAAPRFLSLRPRMATLAPELDLWLVDHCVPLAQAYVYTSGAYVRANEIGQELPPLLDEGVALRARLQLAKRVLMQCGVISGRHLSPLRGTRGYLAVAHDLTALMRFFDDNWPKLEGKTPISRADIERAAEIAGRLLEGTARRRERSAAHTDALQLRQQAFSLLATAYAEVRRAVAFLRAREGDAESYAPSLYCERNTGGRRSAKSAPTR